MKTLMNTSVSISKTQQIGMPFGKSYFKPTPKFWRILGDSLSGIATVMTTIGITKGHPVLAIVAVIAGFLGKTITNSISTK